MAMGSGPKNKGLLAGLPIGQALAIPPRVTSFFGNTEATDEVRKLGFGRALEGDYADDVSGFLTDAGGLVNAAMRKAGFAPEAPSRTALPEQAGRAERAAFDQEAGRQFVAEAAAVIARRPAGTRSTRRRSEMLEDGAQGGRREGAVPAHQAPVAYGVKRRVTLGPVP